MERLHTVLSNHNRNYYNEMIWAACCTAYFNLLHVNEFTSPANQINTGNTLQLADVALNSCTATKIINLTLKQSKTEQFRQGTYIYLGTTNHHICPVQALVNTWQTGEYTRTTFCSTQQQTTNKSNAPRKCI